MTQAFFPLLLLTNDNHMNLKELLEYENISPAGSRTSRPAAAAIARNEGALIPMVLLKKEIQMFVSISLKMGDTFLFVPGSSPFLAVSGR